MTTDNPTANKKIALVTGALGGIGTAICHALIQAGYHIIATYTPKADSTVNRGEAWLEEEGLVRRRRLECQPLLMQLKKQVTLMCW